MFPFGFQFRVTLLSNQVQNGKKIIPLLFQFLQATELTFKLSLTLSYLGRMAGIVPKFWLGGLLLDFVEFRCQAREVKDTSENLGYGR